MKGKTLLVLFTLTLALGSYVYFGIEKPAKEKEASGAKEDLLAPGNLTHVQWFKLTAGEKKIELERQKVGWRITAPVKDLASQSKVESLISALEKFKKSRVLFTPEKLSSEKVDLSQFGLEPPKIVLEYKTSDLSEPARLSLGQQNPSGTSTYARTAREGLVMATMDLDFLGTQSPDDFREMRLSSVGASDYEEVEWITKSKKMKFKKENDTWKMSQPYPDLPLDQDLMRSTIEKIGFIRANKFMDKSPAVLANPDIRLIVGFKEGVSDLRSSESDQRPQGTEIILSRIKKKGTKNNKAPEEYEYYAKADKTEAATVAQFHYDNFTKSPEDFVKKTFDQFLVADVKKITIRKPQKPELVLDHSEKGFSRPNDPQIVEQANIDKLINLLRNLRASKFIDQSSTPKKTLGLDVLIELKDQKKHHFSFDFGTKEAYLWYSAGERTLKYQFPKDPLPLKEFDWEVLSTSFKKEVEKTSQDQAALPGASESEKKDP